MNVGLELYYRFESIVKDLFKALGYVVSDETHRDTDFVFKTPSSRFVVEVKFYRTQRAQLGLIDNAAKQAINAARKHHAKAVVVVSASFTASQITALQEKWEILLIDRSTLINLASPFPEIYDELSTLLEIHPNESSYFIDEELSVSLELDSLPTPAKNKKKNLPPLEQEGSKLCNELNSLPTGTDHWSDYEKLCRRILDYLFQDHLTGWKAQARTDDDLNRFDFVCRIRPSTEFWNFLLENLSSRYIIFEFKNYKDPIKQGQVLTTEKYLLERALRKVAIMITRNGAHESAVKMSQGAMREAGKLIVILDDKQVCKMLKMKEQGSDPTDLLFEITDEFLLSLPR